jgi:hypothetical protein
MPTETLLRYACRSERNDRNHVALTLIACWFLADPWFQNAGIVPEQLLELFDAGLSGLAAHAPHDVFISDPEWREQLARFILAQLGFRPRGESVLDACNRLAALSRSERKRTQLARWAEERAQMIREQLARSTAQECADKWTRE